MPTFRSLADFNRELAQLQKAHDAAALRKITRLQAAAGERIANRFAGRDLGSDRAFSGWVRGNPIALDLNIKATRGAGHVLLPSKSSAGPWTVAEQGRNQGDAGGFAGPGVNRKTGLTSRTKSGAVRKVRARKSKRWNGYTSGKGTASDAVREMDRTLPPIAAVGQRRILAKHFDVT